MIFTIKNDELHKKFVDDLKVALSFMRMPYHEYVEYNDIYDDVALNFKIDDPRGKDVLRIVAKNPDRDKMLLALKDYHNERKNVVFVDFKGKRIH